jgi:hypothetical protein
VIARRAIDGLSDWFDEKFEIIEEADLFCRIAYSWQCQYVAEPLVRYRVHEASASWTKMGLAPQETELMIQKYRHLFPDFEHRFAAELSLLKDFVQYEYAKSDLLKGNTRGARQRLFPVLFQDLRFTALYLLTFSPANVVHSLISIKKVMPASEKHD